MIFPPVDRNPSEKTLRQFGWTMGLALPAIAGVVLWRWRSADGAMSSAGLRFAPLLLAVGVGIWICSRTSLEVSRLLYLGWMFGTRPIGQGVALILLSFLYFVFMMPFALIMKASDPLRRRLGGQSYWEPTRPHPSTLERMRKLF